MRTKERNRLKRFGLLFCLGSLFFTTGCQGLQGTTATENARKNDIEESIHGEGFVGEERYEKDFVKPKTNSNIFVDLKGYTTEDKKLAYFLGENLSQEFFVYDNIEKKLVYTGVLKDIGKKNADGKSVYKGDFSQVTEPGTYYIQTSVIGQSYAFPIYDDRYREQLRELESEFLQQTPEAYYQDFGQTLSEQEKRIHILYSFQKLATAYTFFEEVYSEDFAQKLEEHAQWLIALREDVVAKRAAMEVPDHNNPGSAEQLAAEEDYAFASAMAAGYTALQLKNARLAAGCLSQAQKAYQNAARFRYVRTTGAESEDEVSERLSDLQYMAAAALNRATGSYTYRTFIKNRFSVSERAVSENGLQTESDYVGKEKLWGNLFYMTTAKNADMEICALQMKELMKVCGEYSGYSGKSVFGMASEKEQPLECGIWLTMADYVIVSREYRDVCKAQMHLLFSDVETAEPGHEQKTALIIILGNLEREETE